ncbi:YhaN family protein [Sulfitobacter sp. CW3]|uniref:ATP-binding protein n=1 Tax=Sulfitobacter sp. CW3 TaxID=2861965 RepID=UPI001C5F3E44|nr:YhaN family protein [Sulfitobacter sp. CW3]MBW4963521.1 AAA family ATPase [Sulfitobacter sp. CW3]
MMRLRQLDLDAFGHFTDRKIDFGEAPAGGSDFHIVFGPNEAGKTTLMEGYLRLLFGFPKNDPYAFKHQRANLRVGGVVEIDGAAHSFTRLSKREPNLLDAQGQVTPDTVLTNALRDLSVDEYRKLLCLDDETIEAGGEEITKSKGDIGKLLFSAAAGISDLSQVLEDVNARSLEIYRKGGTKSEFAALKAELAEVNQQIKDQDVSASAYRALRSDLENAQTLETGLRGEEKDLALRKLELENLLKAHPLAAQLRELEAQLKPIAHYPTALDIDPEQLLDLMTKRVALTAAYDQAVHEIEAITAQRGGVVVDPNALDAADQLGALEELKSRAQTGLLDLPRRQAELDHEQAELRAQLSGTLLPTTGDLGRYVLGEADLATMERLKAELTDADKAFATARQEAQDAQAKLQEAMRQVEEAGLNVTGDPSLDRVIATADAEDILARHGEAEHRLATATQAHVDALRKLARPGVKFDTLPEIQVTPAQAAQLNAELAQAQRAADTTAQQRAATQTRWDHARTQVKLSQALPDLIDDATAAATRETRDGLWQVHKAKLDAASANAFETAMQTDDAQTKLRATQSKEIAETRQAQRHEIEAREEHEQAKARHDAALETVEKLNAQLGGYLEQHGLPLALDADDFARWVSDAYQTGEAAAQLVTLETGQADLRAQVQRLKETLYTILGVDSGSLAGVLKLAKAQLAGDEAHKQALASAQTGARSAKAEADRRSAAEEKNQSTRDAARRNWADAVTHYIPDLKTDPLTWDGTRALREIAQTDKTIRKLRRQVETMSANITEFERGLDEIKLESDTGKTGLERYAAYQAQIAEAKELARQSRELETRHAHHQTAAKEAAQQIKVLDEQVQLIAQVFDAAIPTQTLEDLRTATTVARNAIDLRAKVQDTLTTLLSVLGVSSSEAATALLDSHPADASEVALGTVTQDLLRSRTSLERAIETRMAAQIALNGVGADNAVASLVAQKRTIEAQMEDAVLRYLEGRFGHILAEEAIRRYRDAHRSGMLAATEQAFKELTNGAYGQLKTVPTRNGDILQAVQTSDMTLKEAADMSKGTRFQLYLALRAAAYDQMAQNGRILPFFCDDVFETFDEARTRAACMLMQRVGQTGQAIYLTHHQHVVDIARKTCGDQLRVHQL